MLGRVLAANTGKDIGDSIELYGESFQVIGVFESSSVYENGVCLLSRTVLQRLMGRSGQVTGFLVLSDQPGNPKAIAELRTRIEALSPTLKAQPTAEFVHSITQIRVTRAAAWVTAAIATSLAALSVLNTLMLSVIERTAEIGALPHGLAARPGGPADRRRIAAAGARRDWPRLLIGTGPAETIRLLAGNRRPDQRPHGFIRAAARRSGRSLDRIAGGNLSRLVGGAALARQRHATQIKNARVQ